MALLLRGGKEMSSKKQYKRFNIDSIEDACLVLGVLISNVTINFEKYEEYALEAANLLESVGEEYVDAKQYDSINDKLLYRQREILKFVADHQDSSFSYINLRKILDKKKMLSSSLSEEVLKLLNEFLDIRNWTFHNPQSMMVAAKEVLDKKLPNELKGLVKITPQINPVIIPKVQRYELQVLASLVFHTNIRIEQFKTILASMKKDYQEMYDSIGNNVLVLTPSGVSTDVQYIEIYQTSGLTDYNSDIKQVSMAIQKSKYDGSDEKYREVIIRCNEDKTDQADE